MPTLRKLSPHARKQVELSCEVARHDMAVGLIPIFRVLPKKHRRRCEVVGEQKFSGSVVRVRAIEMSVFEQGVFFALLSFALHIDEREIEPALAPLLPTQCAVLKECGRTEIGENLAHKAKTLTVKTSMAKLVRAVGLSAKPGSHTRDAIDSALARLAMATIYVRAEDGRWALTHLIAGARGNGRDSIEVQINPRAAQAIFGHRSYAAISMRDWRSLPSDPAKALYAWLQAWFGGDGSGKPRKASLEKLLGHIYGPAATAKSTQSMRRKACLRALTELARIGWSTKVDNGMVTLCRSTPNTELNYAMH